MPIDLRVAAVAGAFAAAGAMTGAQAQTAWPAKSVRMIVPFAPGGGTDIQARLLSRKFQESTGQSFIVDNRPTAKKASAFPDLPTVDSFYKGFDVDNWYGMFVPAKTPKEVIARFNAEILKALKSPDVREFMAKEGGEPAGTTPEEMNAYFRREVDKFARVIKAGNVHSE